MIMHRCTGWAPFIPLMRKEGELWHPLIGGAVGEIRAVRRRPPVDLEEWTHRGTFAEGHDPERR